MLLAVAAVELRLTVLERNTPPRAARSLLLVCQDTPEKEFDGSGPDIKA